MNKNTIKKEERNNEEARYKRLIATIFYICENAGFHIENRIELRDRKTGKIWR